MTDETQPKTQPTYNKEDKVTISRGNKRGQTGTVIAVDAAKSEYAVNLDGGGLAVVSFSSVKAPEEKVLTASEFDRMNEQATDVNSLAALIYQHFNQTPAF